MSKKTKDTLILPDMVDLERENDLTNVVPFIAPKTNEQGPKDPLDWLSNLEIGTVFLVQNKRANDFALGQFILLHLFEKSAWLTTTTNQKQDLYVSTSRFSRDFTLYEIIAKIEEPTTEIKQEETTEE